MTLIIQKPTGAKLNLAKAFTWNESVWNPSMISTTLWLDAADNPTVFTDSGTTQATDSSSVQQWNDKSGNGYNFTQTTATNKPSYRTSAINSRPAIRTDGNDSLLLGTSNLGRNVSLVTIFAVILVPNAASFNSNASFIYFSNGLNASNARCNLTANVNGNGVLGLAGRRLDSNSNTVVQSSTNNITGSAHIRVGQFDYGAAAVNHWTNGTQDITAAAFLTAGNTSDTASLEGRIFTGATAAPANTDISEVIIVHDTITTNTRQRIEGYLAHKWDLTANLPSDHPYKTVGPTP